MWESLALKFFHRWEAGVWDVEALGSESGDKLAFYRCLKDLPEAEPYARANLSVSTQRVLAGLRAGCLPLQVELGRYSCPKLPSMRDLAKCATRRLKIKSTFCYTVPVSESHELRFGLRYLSATQTSSLMTAGQFASHALHCHTLHAHAFSICLLNSHDVCCPDLLRFPCVPCYICMYT